MSLIDLAEAGRLPDALIRLGIRRLCRQRLVDDHADDPVRQHETLMTRIRELRESPIAIHTDAANEQHYEVPSDFFRYSLGKNLKYSSCFWNPGVSDLDQAEDDMLSLSCQRGELADGQDVLELGCGWGSLTLWMAAHYPNSRITGVSNSHSQREYIEGQARERGLENVRIITCDVNALKLDETFDRVMSIEMFEHMRNYRRLLGNVAGWLRPGGRLFVHVFCHRELLYPFETEGEDNWMGRYFFTGGLMPSADTLLYFQDDLRIDEQWRMSGVHYEKTANAWLALTDANREQILPIMVDTYGADQAEVWLQRWRMFYMACAELFGYDDGREWLVAHYRFIRP